MKSDQLLKTLYNEYVNINSKLPTLNMGGCGLFAEHLYNVLVDLGFNPKLVIITNDPKEMEQLINNEIHHTECMTSIRHIVVKVDRYYIDSKLITSNVDMFGYGRNSRYTDKLSVDVLSEWNKDIERWNDAFDRNKEYLIIKRLNQAKNTIKLNGLNKTLTKKKKSNKKICK